MSKKPKQRYPRIVVEDREEGIRVRVDGAFSAEHTIFMLSQAITTIVVQEQEKKNADVQELSEPDKEETTPVQ